VTASPIQEIVAVFGNPVAGNPNQYVMEKAFARAGLDWRFLTLEVAAAGLADATRGARAMGFRGFDCASPHEQAILPLLDRLSEAAEMSGAVNCVHRDEDKLVGENTHGKGFLRAIAALLDPKGKRVVLLGAGMIARAIAVELALAAVADIQVVNRDAGHGEALAGLLRERTHVSAAYVPWTEPYKTPPETDLLINATSLGSGGSRQRLPLNIDPLRAHAVVADVTVNPPGTRLLSEAADRKRRTLDGLALLAYQTAETFRIWTGVEPDMDLIREALEEFLGI
jgi:shikimate dehydrogenase